MMRIHALLLSTVLALWGVLGCAPESRADVTFSGGGSVASPGSGEEFTGPCTVMGYSSFWYAVIEGGNANQAFIGMEWERTFTLVSTSAASELANPISGTLDEMGVYITGAPDLPSSTNPLTVSLSAGNYSASADFSGSVSVAGVGQLSDSSSIVHQFSVTQ